MKKILYICCIITISFIIVGCGTQKTNIIDEESLSDYDKIVINLLIDWKSFKEYSYQEELSDIKINSLFYTISNENELSVGLDWNYKNGKENVSEKIVILTGDNEEEVNKLYARQIHNNYNNARNSVNKVYDTFLETKEKNLFNDDVIVEDITKDKIDFIQNKLNQQLTEEEALEKERKWNYVLNLPEELEENFVNGYVEYEVEDGMLLGDVAELYRMDVKSIITSNSKFSGRENILMKGMTLKIPASIPKEKLNNSVSGAKKYYKKYNLTGTTDGRIATITFSSNNKCSIDFSNLSRTVNLGSSYSKDYMYITYNEGVCTYETTDEKNFIIKYNGTYNVVHQGIYIEKNVYVIQSENQEMKISFNDDYSSFEKTNGQFQMSNYAVYFDASNTSAKLQFNKQYLTYSHTAWLIFNENGTGTFKYESLSGDQKINITYTINGNYMEVKGTAEGNSLDCTIEDNESLSCSPQDRPGLYSTYSINYQ